MLMLNHIFHIPYTRFEKVCGCDSLSMFAQSDIDDFHNYKLFFSRGPAVPQQMRAVLGKVIITDLSKCRYVILFTVYVGICVYSYYMSICVCVKQPLSYCAIWRVK